MLLTNAPQVFLSALNCHRPPKLALLDFFVQLCVCLALHATSMTMQPLAWQRWRIPLESVLMLTVALRMYARQIVFNDVGRSGRGPAGGRRRVALAEAGASTRALAAATTKINATTDINSINRDNNEQGPRVLIEKLVFESSQRQRSRECLARRGAASSWRCAAAAECRAR